MQVAVYQIYIVVNFVKIFSEKILFTIGAVNY